MGGSISSFMAAKTNRGAALSLVEIE